MSQVDERLNISMGDTLFIFLHAVTAFIISMWANWLSAALAIPLIGFLIWFRHYFLKTSREIKRLEGVLRSPVYNMVSATILGRSSIKALRLDDEVTERFYRSLGKWLSN